MGRDFITLIMSSEAAWKQDLCNCCGDCEACMCGTCCGFCQIYQNAENLGKSGFLYCLLACLFPCIPIMLLRQEARERYNIEGSTGDDAIAPSVVAPASLVRPPWRSRSGETRTRGNGGL